MYRTFEENELPIRPLIGCIDLCGEAFPELLDLHGISLLHSVVAQAPEPAILRKIEVSSDYFYLAVKPGWVSSITKPCLGPVSITDKSGSVTAPTKTNTAVREALCGEDGSQKGEKLITGAVKKVERRGKRSYGLASSP